MLAYSIVVVPIRHLPEILIKLPLCMDMKWVSVESILSKQFVEKLDNIRRTHTNIPLIQLTDQFSNTPINLWNIGSSLGPELQRKQKKSLENWAKVHGRPMPGETGNGGRPEQTDTGPYINILLLHLLWQNFNNITVAWITKPCAVCSVTESVEAS